MRIVDREYKDLIIWHDFNGNVALRICLKEVESFVVDLKTNTLTLVLKNGFSNTYPIHNNTPLENFSFKVE